MKSYRITALAVAGILTVSTLLAGCGSSGEQSKTSEGKNSSSESGTSKEIKTYTLFVNGSGVAEPWSTPVGKKIQEITGVNLNVELLVGSDTRQKAGVMIASGDYPDLISSGEATAEFVAANALIPMDEYIDKYGENIKKVYRPSELNLMKSQYGKTLYIATQRASEDLLYPGAGFYLAKDVLKEAGWPVVKTWSQYTQIIKDYVKKHPDYNGKSTIGFTMPTEGGRMSALQYGAPRYLAGYPNDGPTSVDQDTLEAKIVLTQDYNKPYLQALNDLWNEGILDKEMFMQTNDQYLAKVSSGRVIGAYDQRWGIQDALAALEDQKLYDRTLVGFPVVFDGVEKEYYRGYRALVTSNNIGISTKCKDPEGAFKFLDALVSEKVSKLMYWGIEGEDYTLENGKLKRTPEQWSKTLSLEYQKKQGINIYYYLPGREDTSDKAYSTFPDGNPVQPQRLEEYLNIKYRDFEKDVLSSYKIKTLNDFYAPSLQARYEPGWGLRAKLAADDPAKITVEKALELSSQYIPKIVMAKREGFEPLWKEYQDKLSKLDLKLYEDTITKMIKESSQYYKD